MATSPHTLLGSVLKIGLPEVWQRRGHTAPVWSDGSADQRRQHCYLCAPSGCATPLPKQTSGAVIRSGSIHCENWRLTLVRILLAFPHFTGEVRKLECRGVK